MTNHQVKDLILRYLNDLPLHRSESDQKIKADLKLSNLEFQITISGLMDRDHVRHSGKSNKIITDSGRDFIANSSYETEYQKQQKEESLKSEQLNLDVIQLRNIVFDYPNTKRRAIHGVIVGWLSVAIGLIAIVLPLMCNKRG